MKKQKEREALIRNAASMARTSLKTLYKSILSIEPNGVDGTTSDDFKRVVDAVSDSTARLHSLLLYGEFEKKSKRKRQK